MKRLLLIPIVMVLVCGLIFGGCAKPAPAAPEVAPPQPPIKIGVMYPLTGVLAMVGERVIDGVKLGFEETGYEVAGRKIELIVEDSAANTDVAMDKAKKLVEYDKVCMLIGPLVGYANLGLASYVDKMEVPHVLPACNPLKLIDYKWTFLGGGTENGVAYCMGRYAYDEMGIRTITAMTEDTVSARTNILGAFMDAFKKRGGQVIQEQYPAPLCQDYSAYLGALKDADAVAAWTHGADAMRFLTQFHEFGIRERMPLVGVFITFFDPLLLQHLPPEVADAVIGEFAPASYTDLLKTDASKRFLEAFKTKYGSTPTSYAEIGYKGAQIALEALKATDGDTTPEKLRQAILALEFESPEGPVRFDPKTGCAFTNVIICKVDKIEEEYVLVPVYVYEDVPPRGF